MGGITTKSAFISFMSFIVIAFIINLQSNRYNLFVNVPKVKHNLLELLQF